MDDTREELQRIAVALERMNELTEQRIKITVERKEFDRKFREERVKEASVRADEGQAVLLRLAASQEAYLRESGVAPEDVEKAFEGLLDKDIPDDEDED